MSGLRVYELAKELKVDSSMLIAKLEELNIPVKSHASTLSEEEAQKVRDAVLGPNPQEVVEKRVKPGVIRRRVLKTESSPDVRDEQLPEQREAPFEPSEAPEQYTETPAAPTRDVAVTGEAAPSSAIPHVSHDHQHVERADGGTEPPRPDGQREKTGKKKKKGPKKPIEAIIVRRAEPPVSAPPPRAPQRPVAPATAVAKAQQPAQAQQPAREAGAQPSTQPRRRGPYQKPLLSKEKITKLHVMEPEEPAAPGEVSEETTAEDKKKKKAKKKGLKTPVVVEPVEVKKSQKKTVGRKKEIITRRDSFEGAERMYRPSPRRKKGMPKKMMKKTAITTPKAQKRIIRISGAVQVGELAHRMGIKSGDLIKKLIDLGIMASINQALNFEEATLVAADYGYEVENVEVEEESLLNEDAGKPEDLVRKPPIVTVMGHVDHGKTTLLDSIRRTNVVGGEQGGITQHIGAYTVELPQGRITFIDTPGHEAFTAMRARGAQVTDIVILVVAADDGVMDRTREAISHARAAKVPMIVAVNKIDKPDANPDRVRRQLAELGLNPEDWGGDTLYVNISAKKNIGVKEMLDAILLQADLLDLKANPKVPARGVIIEAKMDKGRGPVASALIQEGTLKAQDIIVSGRQWGRIRAMLDEKGNPVSEATPATAVQVLGLSGVPQAGDDFTVVKDEKVARQVIDRRDEKAREAEATKVVSKVTLEDLYEKIQGTTSKELKMVLKTDVQGSAEALVDSLNHLSTERCKVNIIHSAVGAINENDIMLASASEAAVIGFNVKADPGARKLAEQERVSIRVFGIIYELLDDIQRAMLGQLEPTFVEKIIGHAEIRNVFPIAKLGKIGGCVVTDGKIQRSAKARILRKDKEIWSGRLANLKRFKDDAREVVQGNECGIKLENFDDIEEGDIIEAFILEEIAPSL